MEWWWEGREGGRESSTVTNGLLFGQFERRRTDCRPYVLLLLFGTAGPEQLQDRLQAIRTVVTVRYCRT